LRRYETTFVVNPQADDATIDRQVTAVADLIKNDGGQVLREKRIGTRRLAYSIAGLTQGFYASIIFESEAGVLPKLERHYKLEEPHVRHLTIRYDGQLPLEDETPFDDSHDEIDRDDSRERSSRPGGPRRSRLPATPEDVSGKSADDVDDETESDDEV
jgi:small subunit ribosomal protein S6